MSKVGKITHASVQRPASTNFLRQVEATAFRKFASSQEFMEVRSITSCFGNSEVTAVMKGPENESRATVVSTVGILKSLAAFATIWTLLIVTRRSCD